MINFSQAEWWERSDAAADLYIRGFTRFEDFHAAASQKGVVLRENTNLDSSIPNEIILRLIDKAVYTVPVNDEDGNPRRNEQGLEIQQCVLLCKPCGVYHTDDEEFALPINIFDKQVFEYKEDHMTLVKRWPATIPAIREVKTISNNEFIADMVAQCNKYDELSDSEKATYPKYAIKITVLPMVHSQNFDCTAFRENFPVLIDWVNKKEADASLVLTKELDLVDKTKTYEIPFGVKSIRKYAFRRFGHVFIKIPNSVTNIEESAFFQCWSLTSIIIPNSVTGIGESAFQHCTSLTSIEIPNSVTSIEGGAFYECSSLTTIKIPNGISIISNWLLFDCTSLTSIEIPEGVTSIEEEAFAGCTSLSSIDLPNNLVCIGAGAFAGCSSLTNIVIPNGVTSIGSSAFQN